MIIYIYILFLAEPFRLLNGIGEFLDQLLVRFVGWQVQPVETGMRPWQPCFLANLLNAKPLGSIRPHQFSKAPHGYPTGATYKLEQSGSLFVIHGSHKLKYN